MTKKTSRYLFSATPPPAAVPPVGSDEAGSLPPLPAWLTPGWVSRPTVPSACPPAWWEKPVPPEREAAALLIAAPLRAALGLIRASRFTAALSVLDGILAADPTDLAALLQKGVCLLELGENRAALAVLTAAERLSPHDPDVLLLKADALQELKAYGRAAQVLTRLLAADPDNSFARYRLACCAALNGKPHQALQELRRVVAEDRSFGEEAALDPAFAGLRWMAGFEILLEGLRRA